MRIGKWARRFARFSWKRARRFVGRCWLCCWHPIRHGDVWLSLLGLLIVINGILFEQGGIFRDPSRWPGPILGIHWWEWLIRIKTFPWPLAVGAIGGAIGLFGARWLAAVQLSVKLLERFNSSEMYKIRRRAWNEAILWRAGDRYLLVNFMSTRAYPNLSLRPSDKDQLIAVGQLVEFLAELQVYERERLLPRNILRRLMRDRLSWFAPFLLDLQAAFRDQIEAHRREPQIPYKGLTRQDFRPSAISWAIDTLDLEDHARSPRPAAVPPPVAAVSSEGPPEQTPQNYDGNSPPTDLVRLSISGLRDHRHLQTYTIIMDTSLPRDPAAGLASHPSTGYLRLRRRESASTSGGQASYLLDYYADVPLHGFQRYFVYLDHAPNPQREEALVPDLRAARYWVQRLYYQGVRVTRGFGAVVSRELGLCEPLEQTVSAGNTAAPTNP